MKKQAVKITKNMTFSEIIEKFPEVVEIFLEQGMGCVGCPMAAMETIEEGCKIHRIDPDKLIEKLNKKLKKGKKLEKK